MRFINTIRREMENARVESLSNKRSSILKECLASPHELICEIVHQRKGKDQIEHSQHLQFNSDFGVSVCVCVLRRRLSERERREREQPE